MLVKVVSQQATITFGRIVPVWNIFASRLGSEIWTVGADDGNANHPLYLSEVEVISGDLTDFRFFILPGTDMAGLAHRILVDDIELYKAFMEWDRMAYAEFHRRLAAK